MKWSRLLWLYPSEWRQRYGAEFLAMVEETPATPRAALDVVRGAADAHLRPHLPAEGGKRFPVARAWLRNAAVAFAVQMSLFWVWSFAALLAGWSLGRLTVGNLVLVETRVERGVSASSEANLVVFVAVAVLAATGGTIACERRGRRAAG